MPTAKKQPSGRWKVRVYSHIDPDGKQHYKTFTASTKAEAEQMAARFSNKADRAEYSDLTVAEAVDGYITAKEGVLSPSTIRGYRQILKNYFGSIGHRRIRKLTSADVQTWVSELAKNWSSKTTMNAYGLLTSSVALYAPEISWRVKLPPREKKRAQSISDAEVVALYNAADGDLKIAIGLSAFGSLRRGEICALEYQDILPDGIYVHSDLVRDDAGKWIKKDLPKTLDSVRIVRTVPESVLALIGTGEPSERVVKFLPNSITQAFIKLRDSLGIKFRFQDMRGFFASSAPLVGGISDIDLADFGGWKRGSNVIREHYMKNMEDQTREAARKMREHFDDLLQNHDPNHDPEKEKPADDAGSQAAGYGSRTRKIFGQNSAVSRLCWPLRL